MTLVRRLIAVEVARPPHAVLLTLQRNAEAECLARLAAPEAVGVPKGRLAGARPRGAGGSPGQQRPDLLRVSAAALAVVVSPDDVEA